MADIAIFRINYKSDFILTLQSDAGWLTPFCIKFWTGAPSQAYFVGYDGTTYTHCAPVVGDPTKLAVQFDDHGLPIGNLKFQIGYHFTVADFPTAVEDEVINQAAVIIDQDSTPMQVMLDFQGETAPEIEFALPAYANEAQRIANEQQRIANEEQRIAKEQQRIANETTRQANEAQRIAQEAARVSEFATLKAQSQAATSAANTAADLANAKAQLAADKAALAQAAADLANAKAQLAADKAALADAAATLANDKAQLAADKAALAQQKADYAETQGNYAKTQGDYAKAQGDIALADHERAEADHAVAAADHTTAQADHAQAATDHTTAAADHTTAQADHTQAATDHTTAAADHTTAQADHAQAATDHTTAAADHTTAQADHAQAVSDHAAVEPFADSLGAYDISAAHASGGVLATYADLTAALGTNGANIPEGIRKGGMSVKFVQSSDSKYVSYRLMIQTFSTNESDWQGVDDVPTDSSDNLVTSGGVAEEIMKRSRYSETDEGLFVIDKQKFVGAKIVGGIFDALGLGNNLLSVITALANSLIGESAKVQLVRSTENEGINIADEDGNIVFTLRFSVVEEEGLFLVDDELNIGVQWHGGKWSVCETRTPMVELTTDYILKDVSSEIEDFSFDNNDVIEQVYEKMDELVDTYDFVSKVDAAELMGIEYPFYANGVDTQTTYTDAEGVVSIIDQTPAYKVYMYKFEYHNPACGYGTTVPRKKILIVGGVHGNEIAAPVNLYLLAKEICKGSDVNLFKLFSVFDFYIVPCLNGYGMYHMTRGNARSVNINRNFPIERWYLTGKTNITATNNGYTGPTPGSEFETQLVVALTDYLKPDVAIDHHNYAKQDMQFYSEVPEEPLIPVGYKSLVDCSFAFVKGLPSYFGTSYNLFKNTTAVPVAVPLGIQRNTEGKTSRWWYEKGIGVSATIEICSSINYQNGVYSTNPNYSADAFSVGEYTLRNLLTHYCDYYINKFINF